MHTTPSCVTMMYICVYERFHTYILIGTHDTVDYSKKCCKVETIPSLELKQMRHYIITNCDEVVPRIE